MNIPYGKHTISQEDINSVVKALNSKFISQGPLIDKFEEKIADYCKVKYAVAVCNGTAALHLACLASGFKKGDEVITSPITFIATANSIVYTGARPVFADIDYTTVNISVQEILDKITPKTKGIIPVHFAGLPVDLEKIKQIKNKYNLVIIEDACHALGAEYKNTKIGSCRYSDMSCFSLHPVKTITTGEGGIITTNNKNLYRKLKTLRSHGICRNKNTSSKYGGWFYEMRSLGFNYRVTDFQCALGISQLKRIDSLVKKRKQIAEMYNGIFSEFKEFLDLPGVISNTKSSWHLYVLRFKDKLNINRRQIYDKLRKQGIFAQIHYIPVYKHPFYRLNFPCGKLKNAEEYYKKALSLPIFPDLSKESASRVAKTVINIIKSEAVK